MCWEDKQIGRALETGVKVVNAVDATPTILVAADTRRVAITFSNIQTDPLILNPEQNKTTTQSGFRLTTALLPMTFTIEEHGSLVTGEWWGSGQGADVLVFIATQTLRDHK